MREPTSNVNTIRPTWSGRYTILVTFLFACGLAYEPIYHIIRGSLAYSIIPQDDFYYYFVTAKHFALTGFSSFDGIVPTNGYHPLWMVILAFLNILTHGNDARTFVLMEIVQILSAIATAELTLRLFRKLYGAQQWITPVALLVSLLLTVLIFLSMETVAAIPLYLLFALTVLKLLDEKSNVRDAFLCGVAGTLMCFARLDTLLTLGITGMLLLYYRVGKAKLLAFTSALLPIGIYFILNKWIFGSWLPVSAEAKEISKGLHFTLWPVMAVFTPRGSMYFILTVIGFVLAIRELRRQDQRSGVRFLLFAFPIVYAIILTLRLSWSVYVWYYYPFPISAGAALFEIRNLLKGKTIDFIDRFALAGTIVIIASAAFILSRDIPGLTTHLNLDTSATKAQPNIYSHAMGIKPFTDTHPGRYAMGDRAGLTAFIIGRPILQLEGLVADQALIDSIASRADLLTVLRNYGVRYYIISYPLREFHERNGVWDVYEPHVQEVRPGTPLMHGQFYAPEVFRFPFPVGARLSARDSAIHVTRILDISQARPVNTETN